MLIATFNCNSIRVRLPIILDWLETHHPDVLALQETKCTDDKFPEAEIADAGYHVAYRGQKTYNGVAVITSEKADDASFGLQDGDGGESDTRLAYVQLGDVHIVNTYVPQGGDLQTERFQSKLDWFARLAAFLTQRFDPAASRVVWLGDLNVAPEPMDVYDSDAIWPHVCHCQEVVDAFRNVVSWGLEDIFRKHIPQPEVFTFWDYRDRKALDRGIGWRLDHILATPAMAQHSTECFVDTEPRRAERPSDHTFVAARFDV